MSARDQYARRDRINDMIRISPVRLIGPDNEQLGVVPLDEAKRMAYDQNLDLVEIVADSRPPVCRIMDYGRYKYEQSKKDKRSSGVKKSELKEVRLGRSLKIDPHDVEMRVNQARAFILQGHKVQFIQPMRGREFQYRDQGLARMKEIEQTLADIAKVEVPPRFTGRMIMMIMVGDRSKIHAIRKAEEKAKEKKAEAEGDEERAGAQAAAKGEEK
jgi:translation initiation factor IF-3